MQKRRKPAHRTQYGSHPLPPDFPVCFYLRWSEGDNAPPHGTTVACHNGLEIGYCHEGEGIFSVGGRLFHFGPRFVSVVPPMIPHATWSRKGTRSSWSYSLTDPARLLGAPGNDYALFDTTGFLAEGFPNLLSPAEHPEVERLVAKVLQENERRAAHYQEAIRASFLALLVELSRLAGPSPKHRTAFRADLVERITPALQRIQRHYTDRISVDMLATICHMSRSNFRQIFKQVMGKGPYEHLTEYRVAMACLELRENQKTVEAIAWDNGFPTVSCFVRKFRDIMGIAPRRWARKQQSTTN